MANDQIQVHKGLFTIYGAYVINCCIMPKKIDQHIDGRVLGLAALNYSKSCIVSALTML